VWGYHTAPDIEKVHLYFLKRILKVRKNTVNKYRLIHPWHFHIGHFSSGLQLPLFLKITILVFDKFIYKSYSFEYRFTTSIIVILMVIFYTLKKDCRIKEENQFLVYLIKYQMIVTTMKHFYHCLIHM
jgi:hypothetical protein